MENSKIRTSYARADFLLSSCPYSRLAVHFRFFYTHADYISFPSKLANRFFFKPASRPAHSSVIRHGSDESVVFPWKIDRFSRRFCLTLPSTRRSRVLRWEDIYDGACDAFVFLLSPFLFPSHPPFMSSFSNYQS